VNAGGKDGWIRGLRIQANTVLQGSAARSGKAAGPLAIGVSAGKSCADVRIAGNTVHAGRIDCSAPAGAGVAIEGNRYAGEGPGRIVVSDPAWAGANEGFGVEQPAPEARKK
jgi:hypothetical protein